VRQPDGPVDAPDDAMQMTFRTRLYDLLPVLVVFAVVSAFATFVVVEYVVREPVVVPPPQVTPQDELPVDLRDGRVGDRSTD
jgi:hypothetical protein